MIMWWKNTWFNPLTSSQCDYYWFLMFCYCSFSPSFSLILALIMIYTLLSALYMPLHVHFCIIGNYYVTIQYTFRLQSQGSLLTPCLFDIFIFIYLTSVETVFLSEQKHLQQQCPKIFINIYMHALNSIQFNGDKLESPERECGASFIAWSIIELSYGMVIIFFFLAHYQDIWGKCSYSLWFCLIATVALRCLVRQNS